MAKRTNYGEELRHQSWIAYEFQTLEMLHAAGADVPRPYAMEKNAILMDYIGDLDTAAPTLNSVSLEREEVAPLFDRVIQDVDLLLSNRRIHGDDHPNTLASIHSLGNLLWQTGRHGEAVALMSAAEAAARRVFTGGSAERLASFLTSLGMAHAGSASPQSFASAAALLEEVYTMLASLRGPAHRSTRNCAQTLVNLHEAWDTAEPGTGHDKQAAAWKAKLEAQPKEASK